MKKLSACWFALPLVFAVGCIPQAPPLEESGDGSNGGVGYADVYASTGVVLEKEPQTIGDPDAGRHTLFHGSYMECGIPYKLMAVPRIRAAVGIFLGNGSNMDPLDWREGNNKNLPYWLNAFTNKDGAEVVNANCLLCHGGKFDGEVIIGLPNVNADFTYGLNGGMNLQAFPPELLALVGLTAAETASLNKLVSRAGVIGAATKMHTVGQNPAEQLAVTLMVHHDRDTLAWSDEPYIDFVVRDHDGNPILGDTTVTSDPAPWWRVKKKNALFYNGMARGDHRGTMALATSVCVDDVVTAQQVDDMFVDIQAYLLTLEAPTYKRAIDEDLATAGKMIYDVDCAACHGTYATAEEKAMGIEDSYPNLLIPLEIIGTDPVVAEAGVVHSSDMVEWYNESFYGQITRMVPDDPFPGYMPPPLDGIWATAPFLHNGSVPTLELVLKSWKRPTYWRRANYDSTNFDEDAVGWPYVELQRSQAETPILLRKFVYDTTLWSQSNAGHIFGDHLTNEQRRAVLEYLKTL